MTKKGSAERMTGMKENPSDNDEMSKFRKLFILFTTTFLMVLSFLYLKLINRSVFFLALGCIVISAIKTRYTCKKGEKKPC